MGRTGLKYLIKIIFDNKIEIRIFEISHAGKFQMILSIFNFGTILGLIGGKYFIKIIFDII